MANQQQVRDLRVRCVKGAVSKCYECGATLKVQLDIQLHEPKTCKYKQRKSPEEKVLAL